MFKINMKMESMNESPTYGVCDNRIDGQKEDFRCAFCGPRVRLEYVGEARVETSLDHVTDPNGNGSIEDMYRCPMTDCPSADYQYDTYGDYYFMGDWGERKNKMFFGDWSNLAIGQNPAPFNSIRRQSNVEIYKMGVRDHLFRIEPKWFFFNWGIVAEFKYKANYMGEVLKRWIKFKGLYRDKNCGGTICRATVFHAMFRELRSFLSFRKSFLNTPTAYNRSTLLGFYTPLADWDKRRWRHLNKWIINTFYLKTLMKITASLEKEILQLETENLK